MGPGEVCVSFNLIHLSLGPLQKRQSSDAAALAPMQHTSELHLVVQILIQACSGWSEVC